MAWQRLKPYYSASLGQEDGTDTRCRTERVWHCGRLTSVTNSAPSDDVLGEQLATWGNNLRLEWRLIIETN